MSLAASKGMRLYTDGSVTRLPGAHVYAIESGPNVYAVTVLENGATTCSCPTLIGSCSHEVAALLLDRRDREQAAA